MPGRPDLEEIRSRYQVEDGDMVRYSPKIGPFEATFLGEADVTKTEGEMLDDLTVRRGLVGLNEFRGIASEAFSESRARFPDTPVPGYVPGKDRLAWQSNDGHRDAFRHAYWNALLAKEHGAGWTKAFTTAHEGVPGNAANREAMDLYNNEVGRQIASANPGATREQLAALVEQALRDGKLVVIDRNGNLAWSDQVAIGQHGVAKQETLAPAIGTPKAEPLPPSTSTDRSQDSPRPKPPEAIRAVPRADQPHSPTAPFSLSTNQSAFDRHSPENRDHSDHAMLEQIREGVRRIDAGIGKPYDDTSERLSRSLLLACKEAGLRQVDHVVMGKDGVNLFAVEGQLADAAHLRAHVSTEQAIRTPVEQSDERLLAVNQAIAQQQELARHQELARTPENPNRGGPVMG